MTKIMLVEDDNNLREIYQARLAAEGYEIVAAENGEEALALASKEKPQLIISDVMMPKISGFEMLDILRNTEALRHVKVIMLTALSQAEDNARAGQLGADRYLVKSQVTLEDIVKATHDLLDGEGTAAAAPAADAQAAPAEPAVAAAVSAAPVTPAPTPEAVTPVAETPAADAAPAEPDLTLPAAPSVSLDTPAPAEPAAETPSEPSESETAPIIDVAEAPAITEEPANDEADDKVDAPAETPAVPDAAASEAELDSAQTTSQEESALKDQIDQFLATTNTEGQSTAEPVAAPEAPAEPTPEPAAETPSEPSEPAPVPETTPVPADEPESEYAKDDATPDMGTLPVQQLPENEVGIETDAKAPAEAAPETTPPVEPSVELPESVTPEQSQSDDVVSSAIDSMMSQSPTPAAKPVLPPSEAWAKKESETASAPVMDTPEETPEVDPADLPATTPRPIAPPEETAPAAEPSVVDAQTTRTPKKIIEPLNDTTRPDIHQLLAMEEAKNAATQAGQVIGAAPAPAPAPAPTADTTPPPQPGQGLDPNKIAL